MYEPHPHLDTPPDSAVIWRYLSLDKYLSLLTTKSLYFSSLNSFEDPWEGTSPRDLIEVILSEAQEHQKKGIQRYFVEDIRRSNFVSCWHLNECESAAMWDLYGNRHSSIAIKSTVGRVKNCVSDGVRTFIGRVIYNERYPVRNQGLSTILTPFFKRPSFSHENEVRILRQFNDYLPGKEGLVGSLDIDKCPKFMSCTVDLKNLCEEVYFSPLMPDWLVSTLKEISSAYGVQEKIIIKSDLYSEYII